MHNYLLCLALIAFLMMPTFVSAKYGLEEQERAKTSETFMGQKVPGSSPDRFAPDILTADYLPHGRLTFSADETYIFWAAFIDEGPDQTILFSTFDGEKISRPQVAPFAMTNDGSPALSFDGNRIYFTSERSAAGNEVAVRVWYVDRTNNGWSDPQLLDIDLDPATASLQVSASKSGNLYFSSRMEGEQGPALYWSKQGNNGYARPVLLEGEISDTYFNADPFIAPDEAYILFTSFGRSDGYGIADIYISFRQKDGTWGAARNLGNKVNGEYFERFPSVSPDGKYLFFVRSIGSQFPGEDIDYYWIDARILRQLAPVDLEMTSIKIKPKKPIPRGGSIKLLGKVSNNSDVYSSTTEMTFFLSKKKKVSKKSIQLGTATVESLQPGKSKKIKLNSTIPEKIKPKSYYMIVQVDGDGINQDPDRTNNIWISEKKVSILP